MKTKIDKFTVVDTRIAHSAKPGYAVIIEMTFGDGVTVFGELTRKAALMLRDQLVIELES